MEYLATDRLEEDLSPRMRQILDAAVTVVGQYGFYGASLSQIADLVGVSKPGLLHYISSKRNLLTLLLRYYYDEGGQAARYLREHAVKVLSGEDPTLLLPRFYQLMASSNEERPSLVRMFSVLNAESLDPEHPAHEYFRTRDRLLNDTITALPWEVPRGVSVESVVLAADSAMDGLQVRWLRDTSASLTSLWAQCEQVIFPSPQWDGFR